MTAFVLSRPRILVPGILGAAFLMKGWLIAGMVLLAVAIMKAARLLGDRDLDRWLRQRNTQRQHGIHRSLSYAERNEMGLLERYCEALASAGVDAELQREPMERAWSIVQRAGGKDATMELRAFRQSLPAIPEPLERATGKDEPLRQRLQRELELLEAARRELDGQP